MLAGVENTGGPRHLTLEFIVSEYKGLLRTAKRHFGRWCPTWASVARMLSIAI